MHIITDLVLKYWVNWLCSVMAGLIILLYRRIAALRKQADEREKRRETEQKAMQAAMVALMRDRIFQACRYHFKNGAVTAGDLEVLNALYKSYHDLGGDTIATTLVERVNNLKIMIEDNH